MNKPASVFLLIAIIICVAIRTGHSGWGLVGHVADVNGSVRYGITANPSDSLTYSSWAQQSRMGAWTFSDLYTTTQHASAYFNPFFLVIGWLSRVFSVPPELILNLSVFLSLSIFVYSLNAACRQLGFGGLATLCVLCLCFGGGGVTWFRRVVELLGLHDTFRSVGPADSPWGYPDWFYAELFPVVSFNVSPFHSMSLALMSLVVMLLIRYDDPARRFSWWDGALLIGVSTFLVGIRPYEPVVLLAAYAAYLGYSFLSGPGPGGIRRRAVLFACLCVGIVPFLTYDFWLTRQPVWSEFSQKGLDLFGGADWAGAFLVLWVLAIASVAMLGARALRPPYALLVIWSSIFAAILIVLHSGLTKLCGGCTIPLSLLAGAALERYGQGLRSWRQRLIVAAVVACLAFGSATVLLIRIAKSPPPRVPAEVLVAIDAIRRDSDVPVPAVLTDAATAMYLPGLGGFRVYCGNWGLTDDYDAKVAALAAIGLRVAAPANRPMAPSSTGESDESKLVKEAVAQLREQIKRNVFSYILIDRRYAVPELQKLDDTVNRDLPKCIIYKGKTFCVIKIGPQTIDKIPAQTGPTSAGGNPIEMRPKVGRQPPSHRSVCRHERRASISALSDQSAQMRSAVQSQ
jgi:hypothetical protein